LWEQASAGSTLLPCSEASASARQRSEGGKVEVAMVIYRRWRHPGPWWLQFS
jgi:hypothetical protein